MVMYRTVESSKTKLKGRVFLIKHCESKSIQVRVVSFIYRPSKEYKLREFSSYCIE